MHKNRQKTFPQHIAVILCKKRLQKTAIIRKMRAFWNCRKGPLSKGYSLAKIVTLCKKKCIKTCKNVSTSHCNCCRQKTARRKHPRLEKWKHFESCQKWPPNKGYRLGKIVSLAQKWKMHKNMLKTSLQHIAVVLCNKWLQKTANIRLIRAFWKLP